MDLQPREVDLVGIQKGLLDKPQLQLCILREPHLPELEDKVGPERLDVGLHQSVEQRLGAEGLQPLRDVVRVHEAVLVLRQHLHKPVHLLWAQALGQGLDALAAVAPLQADKDLLLALRGARRWTGRGVGGLGRRRCQRGAPRVGVRTRGRVHGCVAPPLRRGLLRVVVEAAAGVLLTGLLEGLCEGVHGRLYFIAEAVLDGIRGYLHAGKPAGAVCHAPLPEGLDDLRRHLHERAALDEPVIVLLRGRQQQVYVPLL
mmetsp:Transcript_123396/g.343702  ORF Transcript_123396/g.343702 Transcript_123396/m.343702 type:complete len:258 (+) Transcript_123396:986-1759(+)